MRHTLRQHILDILPSSDDRIFKLILMSISQDERERTVFRSRRMYETDYLSNMATAEDRGRRAGMREGIQKGEHEARVAFAKKLLRRNRPMEEIMEDTGLTRSEIESI